LEVLDALPQRVAELRQLARPEDEEQHDQDEQELAEPDVAHGGRTLAQPRRRGYGTRMGLAPDWLRDRRPLVWAHRGASAAAPENTLAAFALAERLGADGVELD